METNDTLIQLDKQKIILSKLIARDSYQNKKNTNFDKKKEKYNRLKVRKRERRRDVNRKEK